MIRKPETNVLVIVGGWNANILLNPEWLKRYLFPAAEQFELKQPLIASIGEPPSVAMQNVRLTLAGRQLSFAPLTSEDTLLSEIEELGVKLSDYLPHTPVVAVGVNFVFEAERAAETTWGPADVDASLSSHGNVTDQSHRYSLPVGKATLNVTVHQPMGGLPVCDLNFHHSVSTLADMKGLLAECHIAEYKSKAETIASEMLSLAAPLGENKHG